MRYKNAEDSGEGIRDLKNTDLAEIGGDKVYCHRPRAASADLLGLILGYMTVCVLGKRFSSARLPANLV